MAGAPLPDWDEDSEALRKNLARVSAAIERDALRRVTPTLAAAKRWHKDMMAGLRVDKPQKVGHFRGESGLEDCWVHVDEAYGSAPKQVAADIEAFEAALQRRLAQLDARYPNAQSLDVRMLRDFPKTA